MQQRDVTAAMHKRQNLEKKTTQMITVLNQNFSDDH